MTEAVYRKLKGALVPANEQSLALFNAMPLGEELLVSYKQGRSVQNHRRFFTFVNHTFDWQDNYEIKRVWIGVLKVLAGHCDLVIDKNKATHFFPKSINFGSMEDEGEFKAFFNNVVEGYLKSDYAQGLNNEQLDMIVEY